MTGYQRVPEITFVVRHHSVRGSGVTNLKQGSYGECLTRLIRLAKTLGLELNARRLEIRDKANRLYFDAVQVDATKTA